MPDGVKPARGFVGCILKQQSILIPLHSMSELSDKRAAG